MTELLPCVEIESHDEPTAAIVWMHGLGANGHDFEPIVPALGLTGVRYIFPHAPSRPVTINGGWVMPAWYDVKSFEPGVADRENETDVRTSWAQVQALIAREEDRGIPSHRIVVAGFSQGGAMALYIGVRHERPLAGILCLSTYLILPHRFATESHEANRETPMLFCHGTEDTLLPVPLGEHAFRQASAWSRGAVEWQTFPVGHSVCLPEVERISIWLRTVLGQRQ